MVQDKDIPTINLTVPTGWEQLDNTQLRYVFGLLAQGFPSPQVNAAIASLNWIDDLPDKTDITALKSAVNIIKGCGTLVDGLRQSFF